MKNISLILEGKKINYGDVKTKDKPTLFKNVLLAAVNIFQIESKGLNISQQREALKILDIIEDCKGDVLELEDAPYEFMKSILGKIRWHDNMRLFVGVVNNFENPIVEKEKSE